MTCREFREHLHEHLDAALGPTDQAGPRGHVAACKECQLAVARAQQFGRTLQHALDRSAATVSLEPEFSRRLLQAVQPPRRVSAARRAWLWLAATPFRAIGAAACIGVLLFALLLNRPFGPSPDTTREHRGEHITFLIDVPFQTDRHSGVTHAEFSAPLKP